MWNEPIHVLGAGSIGLLWTASIRSKFPKYPITVLLRDHAQNRTKVASAGRGGNQTPGDPRLEISWNNHRFPGNKNPVIAPSNEAAPPTHEQQKQQLQDVSLPVQFIHDPKHDQETIQTLIVATKAHQAKTAVQSILDRLLLPAAVANVHAKNQEEGNGEKKHGHSESTAESVVSSKSPTTRQTQIIVLCNGALSVREELSKILPMDNKAISLSLATTTHGAYLSETHRNRLVHAGVGTTFLEHSQASEGMGMVDLWNHAGLKCTSLSSEEMQSMLWNKLAANCVINPLTAIFRCTNGDLLLEPSFPQLQEEILAEVAGVARGVAEQLQPTESPTETMVPAMEEMRAFVQQTIRDTRNNKSSMYQDLIMGNQRKTEIEHLNGYVVRKGREMGKDCPANEDLCLRIAALSAQTNSNRKP